MAHLQPQAPEVLLVDDDAHATEALTDVLETEGYRVRVARNGQEGLSQLDDGYPDVLVLDVEMPVLTGPEMALQMLIQDLGREKIPIILCSGVLNLRSIASQVGTPYFLGKPYTLEALLKVVARALAERTPPAPQFPIGSP